MLALKSYMSINSKYQILRKIWGRYLGVLL